MEKVEKKKKSEYYEQTICTSTRHGQNICEVSKRLAKNCRRSCAHKSIVDEWTGHGTPVSHLRANAGATKINQQVFLFSNFSTNQAVVLKREVPHRGEALVTARHL